MILKLEIVESKVGTTQKISVIEDADFKEDVEYSEKQGLKTRYFELKEMLN